jgi:hypothetical protein
MFKQKSNFFVFSLMIKLYWRRINTSWWYRSWNTMSRRRLSRSWNSMSQNRHEKVARKLKNSVEVCCCFISSRNVTIDVQTKVYSSLMIKKQSRSMFFKSIWKQSRTFFNFASCEFRIRINAFLLFYLFNSHKAVDIA